MQINNQPVILEFFPLRVWTTMLDLPIEQMRADVLEHVNGRVNYTGGYTSWFDSSFVPETITGVVELKQKIHKYSQEYAKAMHFAYDPDSYGLDLWVNVMHRDHYHSLHTHQRSVFSGTFYCHRTVDMSPLMIEDPALPLRNHDLPPEAGKEEENFFSVLQPQSNSLWMWPSWVRHEVPQMRVDGPRISFSFNVHLN